MMQKMLKGIIPFAHDLLNKSVDEGEIVVDATCGNGNDTLFLSNLVGEDGAVYAFDIQAQAIETTEKLLQEHKRTNVTLILDSHAQIEKYLRNDGVETLGGAIFNLGYLPRSDKQIITKGDSTIAAMETLLRYIRVGARIVIVVYHGHDGGKEEKNAVLQFVRELDQTYYAAITYQFINQRNNPPFVVAIEKRKHKN